MQREHTSKPALLKSSSDDAVSVPFGTQLGPVYFLVVIFLLNFVSRIILSPLLPTIEKELAISHSQAGFFFFLTSGGYLVGLLSSGLLASRTKHRVAIVVSSAGVGTAMLTVAFAASLDVIRCGLFAVGFAAGLYMPSAIATITSLVDRAHWGKAIAVHELAPNLAFFISPFIAELFLKWANWRSALGILGALSLLASVSFARFGRGGDCPGESPLSSAFGYPRPNTDILADDHSLRAGRELHRGYLRDAAALSGDGTRLRTDLGEHDSGIFPFAWTHPRASRRLGVG